MRQCDRLLPGSGSCYSKWWVDFNFISFSFTGLICDVHKGFQWLETILWTRIMYFWILKWTVRYCALLGRAVSSYRWIQSSKVPTATSWGHLRLGAPAALAICLTKLQWVWASLEERVFVIKLKLYLFVGIIICKTFWRVSPLPEYFKIWCSNCRLPINFITEAFCLLYFQKDKPPKR